mmetsp:Transcript_29689/g.45883  ORF Transcript_29689/g.45883 Transcript_29689/m.45883 type:complete len:232 (-) Transcript_29689:60-755(-)
MFTPLELLLLDGVCTIDENTFNEYKQQALMLRAVGILHNGHTDDDAIMSVHVAGTSFHQVCSWRGVTCNKQNVVERIIWAKLVTKRDEIATQLKFLHLRWIPSTVRNLNISKQTVIQAPFDTRLLPRDLVDLTITSSGLKGTANLTCLPNHLETLNLRGNSLSGTVFLGNLPTTIRTIDMFWNPIELVSVDNDKLPSCLEFAKFAAPRKPRAVEVTGKKVARRVLTLVVGL